MRPIACRPTWSRNGPKIGRRASASSSIETLPSFGWTSSSPRSGEHGRARRQPHEGGEDFRVGLLGREGAVAVAVEAGVERPDGVDPRRLERPALGRDPQAEEDRPVLRKEDQVVRGITLGRGRRRFLRRARRPGRGP